MPRPVVLVVDPNPATHRRFTDAYPSAGWTVEVARDAQEAKAVADAQPVLLALLSASIPGGSGYQLAEDLKKTHPGATVLLMTGGYEVYNRFRAEAAGVAGHLAKPFTTASLQELVAQTFGTVPSAPAPPPAPSDSPAAALADVPSLQTPLTSAERVATILPRNYDDLPLVAVDPEVVAPALERAVLDVLPEVVEAVLRQALHGSPAFRDLVSAAVAEAVADTVPEVATRLVKARLAELEDAAD